MLVSMWALQLVVPGPVVAADFAIPLIGGGGVEGALIKSGELGFEGVDLELVDGSGKVIDTERTDFDGFFLFERVPYGSYRLRVSAASAGAAGVVTELGVSIKGTTQHLGGWRGAIQAPPQTRIP